MAEENLTPRVSNLETLVEYIVQTQRQLATNQDLLTSMLQLQEQRLKLLEETTAVMQGQIRILLERLLGNT